MPLRRRDRRCELLRGHALSRRVRATVRERVGIVNLSKRMSLRDKRRREGRRRFCRHRPVPAGPVLLADRARGRVEFLVQHALLVAGQAAVVLRRHVVRFLADHVEPVVQLRAVRRGIVAAVDA